MIARRIGCEIDINLVEKMLKDGLFLILFDGLDEANGTIKLDEVQYNRQELTTNQINKMITEYGKNKFVISCRTYNDPKERLVRMPAFIVNPLSENGMKTYLEKRNASELFENIKESSLISLCQNPLVLSTLIKRHQSGYLQTVNKFKVYKFFIDNLLLNWDCKFNKTDACYMNEVLKILSRIGYASLENGSSISYEVIRPEINHKETFAQIIFNSGLLKKVVNNYEFMYSCLQEYFASLELHYKVKNGLMTKEGLKELLKKKIWHEVVLLYSHIEPDVNLVFNSLYELFIEKDDRSYLELAEKCLNSLVEPPKELLEKVCRGMGKGV